MYDESDGANDAADGRNKYVFSYGQVAELVYAHALGACDFGLEGSSPSLSTIKTPELTGVFLLYAMCNYLLCFIPTLKIRQISF
jgi:hypothetical protein